MSLPRPAGSDSTATTRSPGSAGAFRESWTETPYSAGAGSRLSCLSEKYSLSPDPRLWGSDLSPDFVEADDALHNPEVKSALANEHGGLHFSVRGLANLGCLTLLCSGIIALFIVYPVVTSLKDSSLAITGTFNTGGINSTGQVPSMGNFGLIDSDTPQDAYTKTSYKDGSDLTLVFSDEFNVEGRSFYPGDDPYWEAADLHYWATNNLEWYDPAAATTEGGSLVITFSEMQTHGLNYQGGMISSWNKFCFTGGLFEASVQLPGTNNVVGMWPAIWTMGNLGRAGYGATLEGMWPYSYDACDVGTAPNQTLNGLPVAATIDGDAHHDHRLSFLPGQKLSRCTCAGEDHPGPKHTDGTFVGRAAPEIDMLEAQITGNPLVGQVSQSAQFAPFNRAYIWDNTTDNMVIADPSISAQNSFIGSATQQATSVVTTTNQLCYEIPAGGCYSVYAFEYKPGFDNAYIAWVSDDKSSWTLNVAGVGADSTVEISPRPIPQEPMYMIINLGMSRNFGKVDLDHLTFPNHIRVDWVRVYQPSKSINIGCNPKDFPTSDYIESHIEAYTNPNLTTWRDTDQYNRPFPKNSFIESC